ncbi:MAG: peroxide stress protein YaaA [Nitriliruptoraceae bacterium]
MGPSPLSAEIDVTTRALLLLPPSKGKSTGGDGYAFATTLTRGSPLTSGRCEVLAAVVAAAPGLDDAQVVRIGGVRRDQAPATRALLAGLDTAPTMPTHRRYTGIVHGNAGLADLDPSRMDVDVRIVSALMGLVALDEPLPEYRLEFSASLPGLGGIATFWRRHAAEHLRNLATDRRVWDLLPAVHARIWSASTRRDVDCVDVRFLRPDGRPANAARTKVAKGRLAAFLIAHPDVTPREVAGAVDVGPGWTIASEGQGVVATCDL